MLSVRGSGNFAIAVAPDFGLYLNVAKAALVSSAHDVNSLPPGIPMIRAISDILNVQLRGAVYVHAFLAALYRLELIHILYTFLSFVMFLNAITFRLFLGKAKNLWILVPLIAIFPFNAFYNTMVFLSFMGQILSFGLVTLAFYLEYYLSERDRFDPRTCAARVFIISVNTLCWLEGTAFPLVPAIAFAVAIVLNKKYDKKSCASNAAFAGGLWALCNFRLIILFVNLFSILDNTPQGWPMPMTTFMQVSGLLGALTFPGAEFALVIISNGILIPVIVYQMIKEKLSSFLSISCLVFLLLHLFFCARYFEAGGRGSYNVFKSSLSLSFIAIIFILRFLETKLARLLSYGKGTLALSGAKAEIAAAAIFAAFFTLNLVSFGRRVKLIAIADSHVISAQHDALGIFAQSPAYEKVNFIVNINTPLTQSVAEYYTPGGRTYITGLSVEPELRVRHENSFKSDDIYVVDPTFEDMMQTTNAEAIFENDIYRIFRLDGESFLLYECPGISDRIEISLINGEYMALRKLAASKAGLIFACLKNRAANLEFSFYDGNKSNSLSGKLFINGKFLDDVYSHDGFIDVELNGVQMKQGTNDIMLEFDGDVSNLALAGIKIF
jgi:hypothetical protein